MNQGFNNNFNVDYVCPGFCSKCFAEVAIFKGSHEVALGVYRPKVTGLKANFRKLDVHLSNGSIMTVSLCEDCAKLTPDDLPLLMDNEKKGWAKEAVDFSLPESVTSWIEKMQDVKIIDVPNMKWDEATREALSASSQ